MVATNVTIEGLNNRIFYYFISMGPQGTLRMTDWWCSDKKMTCFLSVLEFAACCFIPILITAGMSSGKYTIKQTLLQGTK